MADQDSERDGRTGKFVKGRSGNPSGVRKDSTALASTAPAEVRRGGWRADDWRNFVTGLGMFGRDKRVGTHFALQSLSFDQLKDVWLGDDLAARAVETIPAEAMRQGYDVLVSASEDAAGEATSDPTDLAAAVQDKLDVLGADAYLEVVGNYERGYGGGALLLGANDGQADLTKPLDLSRVRSFDWVTPLEARELMPLYAYNDPRAPKYGQPEVYQLLSRSVLPSYSGNYAATTMLIHESRLVVFPGLRVSRYQVATARGGWGEAVLTRVYRILRDFNQAWSSAGVLVTDFAQSVIKIAGLWEALAQDGESAFQNRLAAMEAARAVTNATVIDAGDEYARQQTPLTGLPDLLEKFAVRLAAACDMPLTLLFGTSPAGMNATGESDVRFFYDRVAAYQRRKMAPALRRLCQIIFRTLGTKREPEKWSVKFRPLWQESQKDRAAAMLTQAQADVAWIGAGVLSPEEVAVAHWGKGEYDPNITVDFEAREAQEQAAASPVLPEDEEALQLPAGYVPPPGPGSAQPPANVPAPGQPSAPDPNTAPVSIVQAADRADLEQVQLLGSPGDAPRTRDERSRFAGGGYGMPTPAQLVARGGHERMAQEHAARAEKHAATSRQHGRDAQAHAQLGQWKKFQKAQRSQIKYQAEAAQSAAQAGYHAARAGTPQARGHAARAQGALTRSDDADPVAESVYQQLLEDYPPSALQWVRSARWSGPADVPLDDIDFREMSTWRAAKEPERVARFKEKIEEGKKKPIVLVRKPDGDEMFVADGHHRATAYYQLEQPARAFIADVDEDAGPWDEMHSSQQTRRSDQDDPVVERLTVVGVEVCVEVRAGDVREHAWVGPVMMTADYGYVKGVRGADGDSLDAYVGTDLDSDRVFVFQQMLPRQPGAWVYFQDKVMLGFDSLDEARAAILAGHAGDSRYVGSAIEVPAQEFLAAVNAARAGGGSLPLQFSQGSPYGAWDDAFRAELRRVPEEYAPGEPSRGDGPSWAADPAIWSKAEAAVDPDGKGSDFDDPWAVVAYVYERMGGSVKADQPGAVTAASGGGLAPPAIEGPPATEEFSITHGASEGRRGDAWSEAAREAALEARRASAKGKSEGSASDKARQASATAHRSTSQAATEKGHAGAAEKHRAAAEANRAVGNDAAVEKHEKLAAMHDKIRGELAEKNGPKVAPEKSEKVEHGGHGEGGPKSEEKHPKGAEGKHGGEHAPGPGGTKHGGDEHGKGHGGHGKGGHHSEFGEHLLEGVKEIGETVAGEKASHVAGQLNVAGGEGHHGGAHGGGHGGGEE
jgi:uncharacterized protein